MGEKRGKNSSDRASIRLVFKSGMCYLMYSVSPRFNPFPRGPFSSREPNRREAGPFRKQNMKQYG